MYDTLALLVLYAVVASVVIVCATIVCQVIVRWLWRLMTR